MPFLNQIKTRLLKMLKLELLKLELLIKMKRLFVKLFLLMKLKLIVLTLLPTNLANPKKIPPRRDGGGVSRRYD
jgi:hypothetical protein